MKKLIIISLLLVLGLNGFGQENMLPDTLEVKKVESLKRPKPWLCGTFDEINLDENVFEQEKDTLQTLEFYFRCAPTSTSNVEVTISKNQFHIWSGNKIFGEPKRDERHGKYKRTDSTTYTHKFNLIELKELNKIISTYKLDSVGLYEEREMVWGIFWKVTIQRDWIKYTIDLPNSEKEGLSKLRCFIEGLIPEDKKPMFFCLFCKEE